MKSIQIRIAALAGACLLGAVVSLVIYGVISESITRGLVANRVSQLSEQITVDSLKNLAGDKAGSIRAKFDLALDAARTMANVFEINKKRGELSRNQVNSILRRVLDDNIEFNGTYSCWEPDAIDGRDAAFHTGQDGNNASTGRFTPYWNRGANGKIAVQPLVEYDTMDRHPNGVLKGGWYIGPRENQKESVLDPFPYIVQGKSVWLTTLSVPIMVDGHFMGVAGTDYNLDFVQRLAEDADKELFNGKGEVTIVSNMGLVVADSEHADLIGKAFSAGGQDAQIIEYVKKGEARGWVDEKTGSVLALAPIELGRTGKPWAVYIRVPKDVVLAKATTLDQEIQSQGTKNAMWQIVVGLLVTTVATAILWIVAGNIAKPIRGAADFARSVLAGDFSQRFKHESADEVGQLALALDDMSQSLLTKAKIAERISQGDLDLSVPLNSEQDQLGRALRLMVDGLNALMRDLRSGSSQISDSANKVEGLSGVLSDGAAKLAESITEIAASMDSMSEQVSMTAQNASQAEEYSTTTQRAAHVGSEHMNEMMAAMKEISDSGERIKNIINAINEITTQTNLLALNAAIEAARAGEQGRGFAVVADEVRKLATNSADAASQATALIGESAEKTRHGFDIAVRTFETLNGIVKSTEDVSQLISDIARASQEQAASIVEINTGLQQIDSVTQNTNGNASDCNDAAGELAVLSGGLNKAISRFKIKV